MKGRDIPAGFDASQRFSKNRATSHSLTVPALSQKGGTTTPRVMSTWSRAPGLGQTNPVGCDVVMGRGPRCVLLLRQYMHLCLLPRTAATITPVPRPTSERRSLRVQLLHPALSAPVIRVAAVQDDLLNALLYNLHPAPGLAFLPLRLPGNSVVVAAAGPATPVGAVMAAARSPDRALLDGGYASGT